ncbi:uncharacterized protein BCR38DRAFT_58439 [Pseudomassariella vexata]|uniref:Glycosyltransferase family 31 protein n=1 Tax=Pseudomassariella vexata TaxID=1141098 RepID=A0A1Y2DJU8_9PEZI|nr:uncharacterized protein BCR38DRAFT_58439 [Pseudomassariella vexata]ORY59501.1 hypothetical protein BCR38DRAFT_58439 [Pseudomassariella vexata]
MIVTPYSSSRRLRLFGGIIVLALLATYVHIRPSWSQRPFRYALGYYDTVSSYFHFPIINNTLYQQGNEGLVSQYHNFSEPCTGFPDTDGILLVMKTGATEAFERLPTQLLTTLQCLPDFLLFSDMEQQIGKHHIYDVLADVEETAKAHNEDFDLYREQKECPVSQKSCVDARSEGHKAWNLDKYKFLPMMEKTWRMRPGRDWYIFAEADTYVFFANMVQWLREQRHFSPKEKIYLGSRSFIGGTPFGHGGSGYVMSGALLCHLIEDHPGIIKQYNVKGANECCGDLMLAMAIEEYEGIKINQAWPMFNGEKPSTLPFGPGHWCEPILTMHHMNAEEISSVWQFEQTRKTDWMRLPQWILQDVIPYLHARRTLLIKDLYHGLVAPKMHVSREDWDNLSDDVCYINPNPEVQQRADGHLRDRQKKPEDMNEVEKNAWRSPAHCSKVCQNEDVPDEDEYERLQHVVPRKDDLQDSASADDTEKAEDTGPSDEAARDAWHKNMRERKRNRTCFQYRWHDEQCCTARSFKLGAPKTRPTDGNTSAKWASGWDLKGIKDWIDATGECTEPAWKKDFS